MRAVLSSFRLDMARIGVLSGGNLVPLLIPILFAVIFSLASKGSSADFGTGGVVGSTFGVCSILPMTAFTYEWQEGHRRMNGMIPVGRVHQVVGRYLTLPVFAALMSAEIAVALGLNVLISYGDLSRMPAMLSAALPGCVWGYLALQLVMFPMLYRWTNVRKATMAFCGLFLVVFAVLMAVLTLVPEPTLDMMAQWCVDALATPAVGVGLGLGSLALVVTISLPVAIRTYRGKEL